MNLDLYRECIHLGKVYKEFYFGKDSKNNKMLYSIHIFIQKD